MVTIGMSNLGWVLILAGLILVYKLAPAPSMRRMRSLSVALIAIAVAYASIA
jgi:predicted metal-binding membrane protein